MKYFMTCFLVLCAAQCFAEELIVRYWDSTFFYTNLDDKRTDYSCNLKTLGQALDTAHKGNRTLRDLSRGRFRRHRCIRKRGRFRKYRCFRERGHVRRYECILRCGGEQWAGTVPCRNARRP